MKKLILLLSACVFGTLAVSAATENSTLAIRKNATKVTLSQASTSDAESTSFRPKKKRKGGKRKSHRCEAYLK